MEPEPMAYDHADLADLAHRAATTLDMAEFARLAGFITGIYLRDGWDAGTAILYTSEFILRKARNAGPKSVARCQDFLSSIRLISAEQEREQARRDFDKTIVELEELQRSLEG